MRDIKGTLRLSYLTPFCGAFRNIVLFLFPMLVLMGSVGAWRSSLYPEDWVPGFEDSEGRFLHDFSYAGYHKGELAIPVSPPGLVYDVSLPPYNADKTGVADSTVAIQTAIDDAGAAGGGIVYLPAGTYSVEPQPILDGSGQLQYQTVTLSSPLSGTKDYLITEGAALRLAENGVVIRGDGVEQTFLKCTASYMRSKNIVHIRAEGTNNDWGLPLPDSTILAASDIPSASHEIPLVSVDGLRIGDDIIVRQDCTLDWANEFGFPKWSTQNLIPDGIAFAREITAINLATKTVTIDIPTRYILKTRDNARIFKVGAYVEECGVEDLSIGMVANLSPSFNNSDNAVPGTMGYEMHSSYMVRFHHAKNCWLQRVDSFRAPENVAAGKNSHMGSNAVYLTKCHQITVRDCMFERAQFNGNGGNGYGISPRGNDCLVQDVVINAARHCYSFRHVSCSGNVLHRCTAQSTGLASDFHQRLSLANLWDSAIVEKGSWLAATYRKSGSQGAAAHTSTENVFWNTHGKGGAESAKGGNWGYDGESAVVSSQFGMGYVVGTKGPQYKVTLEPDPLTQPSIVAAGKAASEAPLDFLEGMGMGDTLEPQSLYLDQLKRRLPHLHDFAMIEVHAPSNIGTNSATFSADVVDAGTAPTDLFFHWGTTNGGDDTAAWDAVIDKGAVSAGTTSHLLSSLGSGQNYWFRARATNGWLGDSVQFATLGVPSVFATGSLVTGTQVAVSGALSGGGANVWIVWDTADRGTASLSAWAGSLLLSDAVLGSFDAQISGLAASTSYTARMYASNALGQAWSAAFAFTTPAATYTLLEDFDSYTLNSAISTQANWGGDTTSTSEYIVAVDPDDASNQVLFFNKADNKEVYLKSSSGLTIPNGTTKTVYFKLRGASDQTEYGGNKTLSSTLSQLITLSDFKVPKLYRNGEASLAIHGLDSTLSFNQVTGLNVNVWYDVWIVADNASDTFSAYAREPGETQFSFRSSDRFRNGTSGNALVTLMFKTWVGGSDGDLWVDDIYIGDGDLHGVSPIPSDPDRDVDGLPDSWELLNFGNDWYSVGAGSDRDKDGFNDLNEYRTGTNPTDSGSFFNVSVAPSTTVPGQYTLVWPTVPGQKYILQSKDSLLDVDWIDVLPMMGATGSTDSLTFSPIQLQTFYRVILVE